MNSQIERAANPVTDHVFSQYAHIWGASSANTNAAPISRKCRYLPDWFVYRILSEHQKESKWPTSLADFFSVGKKVTRRMYRKLWPSIRAEITVIPHVDFGIYRNLEAITARFGSAAAWGVWLSEPHNGTRFVKLATRELWRPETGPSVNQLQRAQIHDLGSFAFRKRYLSFLAEKDVTIFRDLYGSVGSEEIDALSTSAARYIRGEIELADDSRLAVHVHPLPKTNEFLKSALVRTS